MRRIDDSAHKGNSLKPVTRAATGLHTCHFSVSMLSLTTDFADSIRVSVPYSSAVRILTGENTKHGFRKVVVKI